MFYPGLPQGARDYPRRVAANAFAVGSYIRRPTHFSRHSIKAVDDFAEEPGPAFRLVDPNLDQAGGGDIVVALAYLVSGAEIRRQLPIVREQLAQHRLR